MPSIFNKIKNAPIGTVLTYKRKKGVVIEDPKNEFECEDCLYDCGHGKEDVCGKHDPEGSHDPVYPCWKSQHVSGKLVIVQPLTKKTDA